MKRVGGLYSNPTHPTAQTLNPKTLPDGEKGGGAGVFAAHGARPRAGCVDRAQTRPPGQ